MRILELTTVVLSLSVAGAALFASACVPEDERQVTTPRDSEGGGEDEVADTGNSGGGGAFPAASATATITGRVVWDGKLPRARTDAIAGEAFCVKCYPDGNPVAAAYQIDEKSKGVRWCFVEVLGADGKWKFEVPKKKLLLDQIDCIYVPHAIGIMTGQTLNIISSDPIDHNVHFFGKNRLPWTNSIVKKGQPPKEHVFKRPANEKYKCDIHGWMAAAVYVRRHTLFAITDEKGMFTLPKLPAGTYKIKVNHDRWKKGETQEVTVGDGETKEITLKIKK